MSHNTWIWGTHAVSAALKKRPNQVNKIVMTEQFRQKFADMLSCNEIQSNTLFKKAKPEITTNQKMDQAFGRNHQGIAISISQINFWKLDQWMEKQSIKSTIIACDLIEDPHNLGAIIRTAAAFKVNGVLVTKDKQAPFEGTLAKSAAGGIEHIPIVQVVNLSTALKVLQKNFYTVFGLDERGGTKWPICDRNVIVMGQEGKGLRDLTRKCCDELISIDTNKEFPTLNVSVAAAIAISRFVDASK